MTLYKKENKKPPKRNELLLTLGQKIKRRRKKEKRKKKKKCNWYCFIPPSHSIASIVELQSHLIIVYKIQRQNVKIASFCDNKSCT